MNTNIDSQSGFRFTGWHMLAIMVAFFGIIIAVNFFMAAMASKSWTGLVVKNSYVASQRLNEELNAARKQKEAGWRTEVVFGEGIFTLAVSDRNGVAADLEEASLFVGRPAFEQQDRELALERTKRGEYTTRTQLAPGEWALRIEGLIEGQPYRRDARLFVGKDLRGIAR